jgi:asparagine N-glycosylation enzyme membrane subunit Stt3
MPFVLNAAKSEPKAQQADSSINHVFMVIIFIIGIILFIVSWNIESDLESKQCTNSDLKTSVKIVLCISIVLIVSSISFFICSSSKKSPNFGLSFYLATMFILGVTLLVLGTVIDSNSTGTCSTSSNASNIWGIGISLIVVCAMFLYIKQTNTKRM